MKTRTMWAAIALTTMATTVVTGCSNDDETGVIKPAPWVLTRAEQELVNQSNDFAFNLFRTAQDGEQKSMILSPLSITYALGMLNNGAAGETQAQINKVLGFGSMGADSINVFCQKMQNKASALDPLTKVLIANTIYVNKDYELKSDFVQKAKTFYDADPETLNFHDCKTLDIINQWASDHTEKMIQKVLSEETFNPDAVSYLLNAIYFKGNWAQKFNKAETVQEVFNRESCPIEPTYVPMMHQEGEFEYAVTDDIQALRLPYGNGSFVMTVLLPKEALFCLPQVPTAKEWQQLNQQMDSCKLDVKLPRFETSTDIDLKPVMEALGMPDAFNPRKADFCNFCNDPTYIGLMKQVAKIKLDEEGTEAAAVTVIELETSCLVNISFHANHPFLYVISEQQTGAIFFIGQYTGY